MMEPILVWQYNSLIKELLLLQQHSQDPSCPCDSGGEMCSRKHLLTIEALAEETATIEEDDSRAVLLNKLALEAKEHRAKEERKLCGDEIDPEDLGSWTRGWRKEFEQLSLACDLAPAEEALVLEVARMFRKKVEPRWCYPVKETDKELGKLSRTLGTAKKRIAEIQRHLEMPLNICRGQAELLESTTGALDPYGSRCRDPKTGQWVYSEECGFEPAGITTTALGMDGMTRYEFEFKIISADKLVVSHDPFTFTPNPNYPKELQPRLRERAATKIQVEKIAANLEPDAVITDFHVIDRGTPIIGKDSVVEAGNGRVMGIIKAAADHPDKYSNYKDRLRERAHDYGLNPKDVDSIENPILVRVRITDVDRTTFTQEANQAATIAPSAIENARIDAQKITLGMLQELVVGENESLEDALRAPKNQAFAKRFLATLPENVQAALVDAQGYLNRDGVHRMAMGVFVSAFQGDAGLRLAEKAFESIDMDVRNTVNAIARSLGSIAQAEALTRTGDRDSSLSIGDDLAQTINVYSAIKRNPALTVEKYMAQEQIFARELTPFQEGILVVLEEYKGSPKKLANIFTAYAEGVIKAPPPAQVALIPGAEITKESLWLSSILAPEPQPALMEVIRMFERTKGLIPAVKIEITRAEGLHTEVTGKPEVCTREASFGIWSCADHVLVKWSNTAPKEGGYDKCDFKITWEDGETYEGRYDLKHHTIEYPNLAKHVYGFAMFHAGLQKPLHMTNEEYQNYLSREPASSMIPKFQGFLQTYEIGAFNAIDGQVIKGSKLAEVARMFEKDKGDEVAKACGEISNMLKGQPWGAESMLAWAERLKVQADRADGCQSLQEAAYTKAYEVIKIAQPMLKPAKVREAGVAEVAKLFESNAELKKIGWGESAKSAIFTLERAIKTLREAVRKEDLTKVEIAQSYIEDVAKALKGYRNIDIPLSDIAKLFAPMKLLTKEIRDKLPPLYSQEKVEDPVVQVKFFTPDSNWTWYGIEFDGKDRFFGWVVGFEKELGYFSLKELEAARGPLGLAIERDKWFKPQPLSEVKKLHAHERGEMGDEMSSAGFPLNPREVKPEDIDRFYAWADKASSDEVLRELCERADYLGAHLCLAKEGDDLDKEWLEKCPYIGTVDVYSELGQLRFLCYKLTDKLPSSVTILQKGELAQGTMGAIGSAAITGIGIGAGFKFIDYIAGKFGKKELEEREEHPYARQLPKVIDVFKTTIEKHYIDAEACQRKTFRVLKPEKDVLVFICCAKGDELKAGRCHPNPTVHKTIVPRSKKYEDELNHLKLVHPEILINYQTEEVDVEPAVNEEEQKELEAVGQALENAEEVS